MALSVHSNSSAPNNSVERDRPQAALLGSLVASPLRRPLISNVEAVKKLIFRQSDFLFPWQRNFLLPCFHEQLNVAEYCR